jgi:DNA-binding response OmpR family regulator
MIKVLLIDDDERVRDALSVVLRRHDFEVAVASDGDEGLKVFDNWHPDVVVSDILMPNKEGLETIMALRRRAPDVSIVAISGGSRMGKIDFLAMARDLGADRVLLKPLTGSDLIAAIDAACNAH